MIDRQNIPGIVADKLGPQEAVEALSPATVEMPGQIPASGFVAMTNGYLAIIQESALGSVEVTAFQRSQTTFRGSSFGITGKIYSFDTPTGEVKIGGIELPFEQAVEKGFSAPAAASTPPPLQPQPPPPPSRSAPPASMSAPPSPGPRNYSPGPGMQYPGAPQTVNRGPMLAVAIIMGIIVAMAAVGYLFMSAASKEGKTISQKAVSVPADSSAAPAKAGRIIVTDSNGAELINIKKKDAEKYKVIIVGSEYKGKVESDRVKIKDDEGTTYIKVKVKEDGFKATDGNDNTIVKVKPSGDGYKLKNDSVTLARIKQKGGRFVVTSDAGSEMGSAEPEGEGWKVLDANGLHLYSVSGAQGAAAAMMIVLRNNQRAQAGVLIYMNEF